jgi:hypothetical protein
MLPSGEGPKVAHGLLGAVGQSTDTHASHREPPEVSGADQFATLYLADPGEVAPIVWTASFAHMSHAGHVAPHDHVIIAEIAGNDAANRNMVGWDKGMPGTHDYGLAGGSS